MAKEKFDLAKHVTEKLIAKLEEAIESGENAPWHRPWNLGQMAQNLNSKREYRGFLNQLFLMMAGYESPYWNTHEGWRELAYRQWAKREGIKIEKTDIESVRSKKKNRFEKHEDWLARQTENVQRCYAETEGAVGVKSGEKSEMVIYNARVPNKKYDENNPDSGPEFWYILRYFSVFNAEQCENVEVPKAEGEELDFKPIDAAEKLWKEWKQAPPVKHGGNRACYTPAVDKINMPAKGKFKSVESYYKTKFHEGVHATGHESRLKRPEIVKLGKGTDKLEKYGFEELTAEMGACILSAHCNLEDTNGDSEDNSVAYMRGWIKRLKDDPKMAVKASTKAAAAVDHILGVEYDNDDNSKDGE